MKSKNSGMKFAVILTIIIFRALTELVVINSGTKNEESELKLTSSY